jgi:beta-galactosidase
MLNRHKVASWFVVIILALFATLVAVPAGASEPINLAGQWRFAMDRTDTGVKEEWFARELADRINLPGILQAQGYGDEISVDTPWVAALPRDMRWYLLPQYKAYTQPGHVKVPYLSQPPRHYLGVAWYQRDFEIPPSWRDKRVHLFLERPRWETTVWLDDRRIGSSNSLVAPHEFDLGVVAPGQHRLNIRADNRMILPYRPDGHSVSDALGSTWNGIAGRIELSATSPVWIDDAQVFPNVSKKSALLKVQIGNLTGQSGSGELTAGGASAPVTWSADGGKAEIEVPLGDSASLWDEFHPNLQHLMVRLRGGAADDERRLTFGLREITTEDTRFLLNGHEVNFRGTHFGGDFPLTGYPATDVASWKRIIQICKDFGLNHMRFHSWCPPDAAFTAADELGFYLQPECGMWNQISPDTPMARMLEDETARMLKAYGNHPSFLLLSASNEPAARWQQVLPQWAARWHTQDPRRLIAAKTGWGLVGDGPQYDIFAQARGVRGWFGRDYGFVASVRIPILAHEVGQWCAYPDFDVIKKFTGYLQPGNYEIFRDSATQHDVLKMNKSAAWASGRFQLACYKEEIEANLRTPHLGGFQLLDLHDYLGQGGALIGLLDAFWESKGYATPEEFRRFCGPTVPLVRLRGYMLRTSDEFDLIPEIAHFGPEPISGATPVWQIADHAGHVVREGELASREISIGKNIRLGQIVTDLSDLKAPEQYRLTVALRTPANDKIENSWNFWLYPAKIDSAVPDGITFTNKWSEAAERLAAGGKVLFVPPASILDDTCPPLNNVPVFWNRLMNPKLEAMLGLLCDVKHPALAGFPTEANCDWQWTELVRGVRAVNLDHARPELQPIVQAIDDWSRNYKLGMIFECRVGKGRLLVSAVDIMNPPDARPAAQQLRRSLLDYMSSDKFQPRAALSIEESAALWPALTGPGFKAQRQGAPPPEINEGPAEPAAKDR